MKTSHSENGFTLVELAVVMMIIGILIGGILKGSELMQNSRLTTTISEIRAVQAAMTTFRDKYDALPGDMSNAAERLSGCNGAAACNAGGGATGNSVIGDPDWAVTGASWLSQSGTPPAAALQATQEGETVLFWMHLLAADLISGVTGVAITGGIAEWGETHPTTRIGGGLVMGYADGDELPGAPGATPGPNGHVLALALSPASNLSNAAGTQPLRPTRAAQIDRKIDDGHSRTGDVRAYGSTPNCFAGGVSGDNYNETSLSNDCGLIFRIGG